MTTPSLDPAASMAHTCSVILRRSHRSSPILSNLLQNSENSKTKSARALVKQNKDNQRQLDSSNKLILSVAGSIFLLLLLLLDQPVGVQAKSVANNRKNGGKIQNNPHEVMQGIQPSQCHALQPENMNIEDKLVLSPIIFQGIFLKISFSFCSVLWNMEHTWIWYRG